MKYDDATWHFDYLAEDLPRDAAATPIGMFAAWCVLNGLASELHTEDFPEDLERLRLREVTPGGWLINTCDSQFTDEDLNDEGNAFAGAYYVEGPQGFAGDLEKATAGKLPSIYHLSDSWKNYEQLAQLFKFRFDAWRRKAG